MVKTTEQSLSESNGHAATNPDDIIVEGIRKQLDGLEARRAELQSQLDEITPQLKRYEKAMNAILGEPLRKDKRDPETGELIRKPSQQQAAGKPKKKQSISDERVKRVEDVFRDLAKEKDDVSQVEVRAVTGDNSSMTALAVAELRSRGVIRFASQRGLTKNFRLTRAALNGEQLQPELTEGDDA